jgi:hypothetical protein
MSFPRVKSLPVSAVHQALAKARQHEKALAAAADGK